MRWAAGSGGVRDFHQDGLARTYGVSGPEGFVREWYDAAGRRSGLAGPDGVSVVYDYDLTDALTAVRENGVVSGPGVLALFGYDDLGRRASLHRGALGVGAVTVYGYDGGSRLSSLSHDLAGTAQDLTLSFGYNPAERPPGFALGRSAPFRDGRGVC